MSIPDLNMRIFQACIRYAQELIQSGRVYSTTHQEKITG